MLCILWLDKIISDAAQIAEMIEKRLKAKFPLLKYYFYKYIKLKLGT